MTEIPESLLKRSAEAKAKALGLPVEQVIAEMKGEALPATPPTTPQPEPEPMIETEMEEIPVADELPAEEPAIEADSEPALVEEVSAAAAETEEAPVAVATIVEEPAPVVEGNGGGNGRVAATVSPRPVVPPAGTPEGVRTQRLLTVVKARAIQSVKAEPTDKVNTWPHLMLMEFGALLAMTGFLVILSVIIHSPLLDPANIITPNPSKAPWYFLGLQELLSYFDPQIAGVTVPTITGLIGFMMIPYVDKNPSTRPSDRKFAIALYSIFLAGAATLTIMGVLFRGRGFNFSYPWKDGVFFDDLKDWVQFE